MSERDSEREEDFNDAESHDGVQDNEEVPVRNQNNDVKPVNDVLETKEV